MYNALFVCQSIAEKLGSPEDMLDRSTLEDVSFSEGLPGIAFFYSAMHQAFPNDGWDAYVEKYAAIALEKLKQNKEVTCSVFNGWSGFGLALGALLDESPKFEKLRKNFDALFIQEVRHNYLDHPNIFLDENKILPTTYYNFSLGLSGIISYLLSRRTNPYLQQFAQECGENLTQVLLFERALNGSVLPSWYTPSEDLLVECKEFYPQGGFDLSFPFGITGCLSALSQLILSGSCSPFITQGLRFIAEWLREICRAAIDLSYWNASIPREGQIPVLPPEYDLLQHTWIAGWPAMAKGLILASQALKDSSLFELSKELSSTFLSKADAMKLAGSSLSFGMSGLMTTLSYLAKEYKDSKFLRMVDDLETHIIDLYNPNYRFGFQQYTLDLAGAPISLDKPGLFDGAAGVAFALLTTRKQLDGPFIF